MLRFFAVATALLLLTAPGFFSEHTYVIDRVNSEGVFLEPLEDVDLPVLYQKQSALPDGVEGNLVTILKGGIHILRLTITEEETEQRKTEIQQLLAQLANPVVSSD